jgi:hypothetical protein
MGRVSYFVAARGFGPAACVPGATGADVAGTGGADTVGAVAAAAGAPGGADCDGGLVGRAAVVAPANASRNLR